MVTCVQSVISVLHTPLCSDVLCVLVLAKFLSRVLLRRVGWNNTMVKMVLGQASLTYSTEQAQEVPESPGWPALLVTFTGRYADWVV